MSGTRPASTLAEELTSRLARIDGVVSVFPPRSVLRLPLRPVPDRLVEVRPGGSSVDVHARLATSRDVPAPEVVRRVREAVLEVLGPQRCSLRIEIALIE